MLCTYISVLIFSVLTSRSDVIQHGDTVIGTRFNPNLPLYKVLGSYLCRARLHSHRFARFFTFGLSQID